ncbi:MAG: hypothetical protein KKA44_07145 [Alphaproteobacteria bacterium]|nr:hypothetical protein [Alphaproteobacteria bacterium]MBU0864190.1 hypothetical protein [Alphaproteobacteria bacterium]MBU1824736.1 hypothetical protein [Alphaproteobacteria bacterium]
MPFALIGATIIGTIIAVLIGRKLDQPARASKTVLAYSVPGKSNILDFSSKNIMLAPKAAPAPLERLFEQEIGISNIGFECVEDIEITVKTKYDKKFDPEQDFSDYSVETIPSGMKYEIKNVASESDSSEYKILIPFMNRSDVLKIKKISSADSSISVFMHKINTDFVEVKDLSPLPTVRQRLITQIGQGRLIEASGGIAAAALAASLLSLLGS